MREQSGMRRLLSGILLMVIVHEWMRPLSELSNWTDVYSITPLVITIAGVLAVDVLKIPRLFTWIVKLLVILSAVAAMFHGKNLLHVDLWFNYSMMFMNDIIYILMGQWDSISAEGRTLLFIGAWSIVICWLYSVILYQRIALYTTMFTVGYLVLLQTWLGLDTTKGIVLAVVSGLFLHGLSVLPVLESLFDMRAKLPGWPTRWLLSSVLLVSITVGCGLLLSMGQERAVQKISIEDWNWRALEALSPFAFQSFPGYTSKQQEQSMRSGYSQDDTSLGGSVKSNDSVAFLANTERPDAYWRGESKTVYDGKGWSNLANDLYGYEAGSMLPDVLSAWSDSSQQQEPMIIQEVFPMPDYPTHNHTAVLLSNGAIRHVDRIVSTQGDMSTESVITLDRIEGKFTLQGGGSSSLASYMVMSTAPITSETAQQVLTASTREGTVPDSISIPNLQLPEQLPERVSRLAKSITDELDTPWEKADAIKQYLQLHYTYTLRPKKLDQEGDFVDSFLFELKEGYCDYFSTSMTIMLRSIGIPAQYLL